ncbi:hypothetical protein E2C01_018718 [Portunus trituberculatus]|uniref:Uncharacterized protein n=1 Tax=Portunus trituberculatus TaxID=210409 RepID=A0A5B7DW01_PORTR|nr:hypothetical protein [Portunus trituberculatus]
MVASGGRERQGSRVALVRQMQLSVPPNWSDPISPLACVHQSLPRFHSVALNSPTRSHPHSPSPSLTPPIVHTARQTFPINNPLTVKPQTLPPSSHQSSSAIPGVDAQTTKIFHRP